MGSRGDRDGVAGCGGCDDGGGGGRGDMNGSDTDGCMASSRGEVVGLGGSVDGSKGDDICDDIWEDGCEDGCGGDSCASDVKDGAAFVSVCA